ncbi:MAG: diguanylate cyclase with sensor [Frankiales bacterium]|nr:diguanylate cyclase with sensor [Frankiales bacterium]
MTLRWRLTIAFVLVVLVPLLLGLVLASRAFPDAVQARQKTGVVSSTRLVGAVLQDYCDRAKTAAEAAGRAATTTGPAGARAAAGSLVARGLADGIRVVTGADGATGAVVAKAGRVPVQPEDCGGEPSTGAAGPYLSAVVVLTTANGRAAGSAVATFDVSGRLLTRLQQAIGEGDVVLVGSTGRVVAGTKRFRPQVIRDSFSDPPGTRLYGLVSSYLPSARGQAYGVVVLQPAAQGPGLLVDAGAVVVVAVLLAVGIAVISARATTQPLEELGEAAARIASGDLSTVIEVRSKDEVGRLAGAFNAMTEDLRGYVGQLEASRDELQAGLARLGDTLSSTHDLDRILHVVLESAMASTRASGGMVLLLTPSRDELVLAASRGVDVPLDLRLSVGEGVSGQVALSGDPVRGRVGHGPGELRPAEGEPVETSLIAVPLKSSGTVIGVLDLFGSVLPAGFDDNDLATIRTFASQATVAVDNVLLHEEAQRLSITDGLTGLWNYRYFTMTVSKEIERAARFARPLALLMLDLDHFKDVNDTFGHQRGDAVLVELAGRIRGEVRDVDTVARYGGEEIVVILPETDEAGAVQLAERICHAVSRKPFGEPGVPPVHLTVSAGAAVFPAHGLAASVLLARADEALYAAKRSGRNTWRLSDGVAAATHLPD